MMRNPSRCALGIVTCVLSIHVGAQAPPVRDEGRQLLEEQRAREREERLMQQTPEPKQAQPQPAAPDDFANPEDVADVEPMFLIERIALKGNTLLSDEEVRSIVAPFLNKRLGVNRLNLLLRRLTRSYIDRGYITTRVYVGRQ